jgi:predicted PurR-regulated permease PerM
MFNWIVEHVTLPYVLTLVAGLLLGYGINWFVCRRKARKLGVSVPKSDGLLVIVSLIIVIAMVWIMVSVQQARNCSIRLAVSTSQEEAANKVERDAFQQAITESLKIPPDVLSLDQNDPARKAYTDPIQARYLAGVSKANDMRQRNRAVEEDARKACGT